MALSNISKEHVNNLLELVNMNELDNNKIIQTIQRNSNNYGKLKTLFKQIQFIKNEINEIIQDSIVSNELDNVKCSFKKIPGKTYYLYNKECKRETGTIKNETVENVENVETVENVDLNRNSNTKEMYFSILSPEEWNKHDTFIGAYLYDYDLTFNKINDFF